MSVVRVPSVCTVTVYITSILWYTVFDMSGIIIIKNK